MEPTRLRQLASLFAILAVVVCVTVSGLRVLDVFARHYVSDDDETRFASVADLERAAADRLVLPAFFPESLVWPPAEIRARGGRRPHAVLLSFRGRADGKARLLVGQTLRGAGAFPARLEPEGTVLESEPLDGLPEARGARLARLVGPDGAVWHEVRLETAGRTVLVRLRGGEEELLRLAASLHREGP